MIKIYTTSVCPKCQRLKAYLDKLGIEYQTLDMETAEGRTELLYNGVFALEAPVLQADSAFFTSRELFQGQEIRGEIREELKMYLYLRGIGA